MEGGFVIEDAGIVLRDLNMDIEEDEVELTDDIEAVSVLRIEEGVLVKF